MFMLSFSSSKICQYVIYNDKKRCVRTTTPPLVQFLLLGGGKLGQIESEIPLSWTRFALLKVITHTTVKETKL